MTDANPPLLLAGLGHAHLFVLESLARGEWPAVPVVLVTPPEYDYSGMISGVVAGQYRPGRSRFDPERVARAAGATWVPGRVRRIDPSARRVELEDGASLPFRLHSLDVGSRAAGSDLPGVREHAISVKPVRNAIRFRAAAGRAADDAAPGAFARIVIVGGGSAGTELALCTAAALARHHPAGRFRVRLVERGSAILEHYPGRFRAVALRLLGERGVEVDCGVEVEAVDRARLRTTSGEIGFDTLLWATGPAAPSLFRRSGLATDPSGYLSVGANLRSVRHPDLFAAGDCATLEEFPWVERAGVYAVRQGPVLARNLRRALRGEPLERYTPQRHWLSLMNTGDGRALASYRGRTYHGRAAWWLKHWIDRRFVDRFQALGRPD